MSGSLSKAYDRVKSIDWDPTYIKPEEKLVEKTRFHLEGLKPLDPFKTTVGEYFKMEMEKDNRHYAILEAASRLAPRLTEPVASYYAGLAWQGAAERTKARAAFQRVIEPMPASNWLMDMLPDLASTKIMIGST